MAKRPHNCQLWSRRRESELRRISARYITREESRKKRFTYGFLLTVSSATTEGRLWFVRSAFHKTSLALKSGILCTKGDHPWNPFQSMGNIVRNWRRVIFHLLHMWLECYPNPNKMEQSWECTFLKPFRHMKIKLASKKDFIIGLQNYQLAWAGSAMHAS